MITKSTDTEPLNQPLVQVQPSVYAMVRSDPAWVVCEPVDAPYAPSGDFNSHRLELEAQVRSDDYLPMLATALETISLTLHKTQLAEKLRLETLANDLQYLHVRYQLRKREFKK